MSGLGSGRTARLTEWRVDGSHANAYSAWQAMGSPQSPNDVQYAELERASRLLPEPTRDLAVRSGRTSVDVVVPRQGVALFVVEGARR